VTSAPNLGGVVPAVNPLEAILRQLTERSASSRVRVWAQALLKRGEAASSDAPGVRRALREGDAITSPQRGSKAVTRRA